MISGHPMGWPEFLFRRRFSKCECQEQPQGQENQGNHKACLIEKMCESVTKSRENKFGSMKDRTLDDTAQ